MRRTMFVAASVVPVLIVAATALLPAQTRDFEPLSCDNADNRRDRGEVFCEIRETTVTSATLDVDAGANGGIRVRGADRTGARVRVMVVAVGRTAASARDLAGQVDVTTNGGRVRVDGPDNRGNDRNRDEWWYANIEVEAAQNGDLTLNTRNGGISIDDFRGRASFSAVNGGVSLREVNGDIRGETTNGGINVALSGNRWNGAGLDVRTVNGGVRMSLPASYSAVLETGTVNGGLDIDFPVVVQGRLPASRNRTLTATIGDGGPRIRAVTTNGGVTISRR